MSAFPLFHIVTPIARVNELRERGKKGLQRTSCENLVLS